MSLPAGQLCFDSIPESAVFGKFVLLESVTVYLLSTVLEVLLVVSLCCGSR